jgi:molybdopterin-guanine dinucleotide biosynthesis protein A
MSNESKDSEPPNPLIQGITGVILAGGKSFRFGKNKALIKINGTRLIERVARVMGSIFEHVILISNTPHEYEYLHLPIYQDKIKDLGPIGGLYTGLNVIENKAAFFVACDMPFLNEELIRYLIQVKESYDAVVPRIDWKIESLHAIYTKQCLPAIHHSIALKNFQLITFLNKVHVKYIEEDALKLFDPELRSFMNINRPDELTGIQKQTSHSEVKTR